MSTVRYEVTPSPKVRMTKRDTWATAKVRPAVQRWRAFAAECQRLGIVVEDGIDVTFVLPMAASWSAKKKLAHVGLPHRNKPDVDNLLGGLFDACLPGGDQHVAEVAGIRKVWGLEGCIIVTRRNLKDGA